jgi:aspartyl-tRNA(Asn)/glutamyl-tRNA(Gln) amidotransferase subunit C
MSRRRRRCVLRRDGESRRSRRAFADAPRIRTTVIERDEVLHVARLARLALGEDEIEPMARELSAVLDHIAKISELDLADVAPTSHVADSSTMSVALMPAGWVPGSPRR